MTQNMMDISGFSLLIFQVFLFPPIERLLGPINSIRVAAVTMACSYSPSFIRAKIIFDLFLMRTIFQNAGFVYAFACCLSIYVKYIRASTQAYHKFRIFAEECSFYDHYY